MRFGRRRGLLAVARGWSHRRLRRRQGGTRLKLLGIATYHPEPSPDLVAALGGDLIRNDGAITADVVATDWNCPKYITRRFTPDQVTLITDPLYDRIERLETELAAIKAPVDAGDGATPEGKS